MRHQEIKGSYSDNKGNEFIINYVNDHFVEGSLTIHDLADFINADFSGLNIVVNQNHSFFFYMKRNLHTGIRNLKYAISGEILSEKGSIKLKIIQYTRKDDTSLVEELILQKSNLSVNGSKFHNGFPEKSNDVN